MLRGGVAVQRALFDEFGLDLFDSLVLSDYRLGGAVVVCHVKSCFFVGFGGLGVGGVFLGGH